MQERRFQKWIPIVNEADHAGQLYARVQDFCDDYLRLEDEEAAAKARAARARATRDAGGQGGKNNLTPNARACRRARVRARREVSMSSFPPQAAHPLFFLDAHP